jgi:catalase
MAARRPTASPRSTSSPKARPRRAGPASTVSGPLKPAREAKPSVADEPDRKLRATAEVAAAMPYNPNKALEYGDASREPHAGPAIDRIAPVVSTVSEGAQSGKVGAGAPAPGENRTIGSLDRVRVDASGQALTTDQGVRIADNQSSLKAGLRGPALLEDFILREKITHFDHERVPERVVHARGSGAHGYFESYADHRKLTRAAPFAAAGKRTPVFVRFSTVIGERGSTDTARDVRGFAVKFYTDEGNWDLVGNNMPVFFIQDAMKFPDLVHAAKPEPHFAMPQAATAHDTFWDFVSLMPESTHMLMWAMSDRAIPRSYRMMQGFGVHTFRFVNAQGESRFVKFHWNPLAGTHSLDWDEAVKISGADPDFHRRDLWEAIEAGVHPEYELGVQIFTERDAEKWSFDVLDATKLVPEELVPVTPLGRMVLDRNPDNFFAETEQVAFCTAHVIPGIDFSNDPLLAGRIHSYVDTQISRLGGPNFHEIPINSPVAQVHNNQRDGMHRQAIARGRVAYEPNSLGGGCPFQAGIAAGFTSHPEPIADDKLRGKPERFAEHYLQATLFWNSQTEVERAHIARAFRFELTKVQTAPVRERVVAMLANVDAELAQRLAADLGIRCPAALPRALDPPPVPEITVSPALSLRARPGDGSIAGLRVAVLIADGVDGASTTSLRQALASRGAVCRMLGVRLGSVETTRGGLEVDATIETMPAVLFDALAVPDGDDSARTLAALGQVREFVADQYRHCKPILALGAASAVLEATGIPTALPSGNDDPGVIRGAAGTAKEAIDRFAEALVVRRHHERERDPPRV